MQTQLIKHRVFENRDTELLTNLGNEVIMSVNDKYGRIVLANNNFCKLLGLNKHNIIGESNDILKSPAHRDEVYQNLWKTIKNGQKWEGVLYYQLSESKFYWLKTTITPLNERPGEGQKFLCIYTDITDYYSKQNNSNALDKQQSSVLKKFTNTLVSINERGKIIKASHVFKKKEYDGVVGSYLFDFIDNDYHEAIKVTLKEVFTSGNTSEYQFLARTKKGNKALFISEVEPVFNKFNEVIFANISTQRKTKDIKIVNELKSIETKYSSLFQSINSGIIIVTDGNGNITEWNKGAEKAFNYTESEVLGKSLTMLISNTSFDSDISELLRVKDSLDATNEGDTIEMTGLKKCGAEFPVELVISTWICGIKRCYGAMMLDITKRKLLENQLKQKTEDLELFLYRAAHDLKAPFTSAEGLVNLIELEVNDSPLKHLIEMLKVSLERGKLLVDNLAFASLISEKKNEITKINFKKEINNIINSLSGLENFEAIKFDVNIDDTVAFYSNKELLYSVLQNLIQNAITYLRPSTKTLQPAISIDIYQSIKQVGITISDNGMGISKDNLDKVFNLYYRIPNEGTQGTGLGLYIVKNIIEDLNGEISVESELLNGSTFKIMIPNLLNKA